MYNIVSKYQSLINLIYNTYTIFHIRHINIKEAEIYSIHLMSFIEFFVCGASISNYYKNQLLLSISICKIMIINTNSLHLR